MDSLIEQFNSEDGNPEDANSMTVVQGTNKIVSDDKDKEFEVNKNMELEKDSNKHEHEASVGGFNMTSAADIMKQNFAMAAAAAAAAAASVAAQQSRLSFSVDSLLVIRFN